MISSMIWALLERNCRWIIGTGEQIHFWNDICLYDSYLVEVFHIPPEVHLSALVSDFLHDTTRHIPQIICDRNSNFLNDLSKVVLSMYRVPYHPMWINVGEGVLTFKASYEFYPLVRNIVNWNKLTWKKCIPLSNSFLVWRLLHNKVPTNDNLRFYDCIVVSRCSLCGSIKETSSHLFFT